MTAFFRRLRSNPLAVLLLMAVTTGAVGCMGAAYLIMDAVLWRPLPGVPDARNLVVVSFLSDTGSALPVPLAYFDDLSAAASEGDWCPVSFGSRSRVSYGGVTDSRVAFYWQPSCDSVFQVSPVLGRFTGEGADAHRTVVLSERSWVRDFGRDPDVVGKSMVVDDLPVVIVGVAPAAFMGLSVEIGPDIFLPLTVESGRLQNGSTPVSFRYMVGRQPDHTADGLAGAIGTRLTQLMAGGSVVLSEARRTALDRATVRVDATGRGQSYLRDGYAESISALVLVAVLLLVMAVVNVSGVVYAQTRTRDREFVIRSYLGARSGQTWRLLLWELAWPIGIGVVLAVPVAVVLARTVSQKLWASQAVNSIILEPTAPLLGVLAALGAVVTCVALMSAAWACGRMTDGGWLPARPCHQSRVGAGFAATQCAFSVAILFVATTLVVGVRDLARTDLGFNRDHLAFVRLLPARSGLEPAGQHQHYENLAQHLAQLPGVTHVTLASTFPNHVRANVRKDASGEQVTVSLEKASPNFFDAVGMSLRSGRVFSSADTPATPRVAIITEGLAGQLFPGQSAIGHTIFVDNPKGPHMIVGVVGDVRPAGARLPPVPTVYVARTQEPNLNPMLVVRTAGDASAILNPMMSEIQRRGRDYPVGLSTIEDHLGRALAPERTLHMLALVLGVFVTVLAGIGLFAQQVTWALGQRRSTIVRMVLGESPGIVVFRLLRRAALVVTLGALVGIPLAVTGVSLLRQVLPGLGAVSPLLLAGLVGVVVAAGTAVSYLPTRFLSRLPATEVLRAER